MRHIICELLNLAYVLSFHLCPAEKHALYQTFICTSKGTIYILRRGLDVWDFSMWGFSMHSMDATRVSHVMYVAE